MYILRYECKFEISFTCVAGYGAPSDFSKQLKPVIQNS